MFLKKPKPDLKAHYSFVDLIIFLTKQVLSCVHSRVLDIGKQGTENRRKPTMAAKPWPFVPRIMTARLPEPFTMPDNNRIPYYDGKADAFEHVDRYLCFMNVWRASDEVLCRVFPATLSDTALRWFWKLPEASISTFNQLSEAFLERFALTMVFRKDDEALCHMEQREGESIRSWWGRYVAAASEAEDFASSRFVANDFIKGVRDEEVRFRLRERGIQSLEQLRESMEGEVRLEIYHELDGITGGYAASYSDDYKPIPRSNARKRKWQNRRRR